MANKNIVKDSLLPIFVKQVNLGTTAPAIGDFVVFGAIKGVVGDTPRKGEDGNFYSTVDTAAEVMVDGVTGTWTIGAPVYRASNGSFNSTNTNTLVGYATRAKSNTAAGKLFIQLVPSAI